MTRKCRPNARLRALALIPVLVLGSLAVAQPAAAQDADHLILSEIVTTVQRAGARFIEIVNPTGADVALDDVCLTTGTNATNGAGYWRIVESEVTSATAGGGTGGFFHGRFPAGATIAAGDTITVSVTGSTLFQAAYGRLPDFEVFEDATTVPDAVPELVEVFPGSINAGALAGGTNAVTLLGSGSVALYTWDGASDLVADLDYAHWGTNQGFRVDKTGYTFGASTYLDDTPIGSQTPLPGAAADGRSYMRNTAGEGTEATPGNGATGHDETSEALGTTWTVVTPQAPAAAPASWLPTAPIFGVPNVADPTPRAGQAAVVAVKLVSATALTSVTVHYSVDGGAALVVPAADAGAGLWTATVPGQAEGAVVAWWAVADNAAGGQAVHPAGAPRFTKGWTTGPAVLPGEAPDKILITEVNAGENVYPYTGMSQLVMEFVEFHNPGDTPVDLSNYYVTDAINYYNGENLYWKIANGPPHTYADVGGGNYNDFTARFPDGFVIPAKGTIVLAMHGNEGFENVYGVSPDIELYEDGDVGDGIPDMRPVFVNPASDLEGDSIYTSGRTAGSDGFPRGIPDLEEHYGEPLILFHWNEGNDLVTDIDVFCWGNEKTGAYRVSFDKTGVTSGASTYAADTLPANQQWFTAVDESGTRSYTRIDADETGQRVVGSNGVDGRDETSEPLPETFAVMIPTPGLFLAGAVGQAESIVLKVPAKTFLPGIGESFRVYFVGLPACETRVRIFDLRGRLVFTLWDSRFDGEPSTIADFPSFVDWDGRDDVYERVPAGMYVVHLSVTNRVTGEEETRTAPVVVATRLSK